MKSTWGRRRRAADTQIAGTRAFCASRVATRSKALASPAVWIASINSWKVFSTGFIVGHDKRAAVKNDRRVSSSSEKLTSQFASRMAFGKRSKITIPEVD